MPIVIIPAFSHKMPMRVLYLYNTESEERGEEIDITGMRPRDIVLEESRLWAKIVDPWVVRDSENDD